jgi:hypothetical protein
MVKSYATGSLSGYSRVKVLPEEENLEIAVLEAKSKARKVATEKATTLLRIVHYGEWKDNFARFYMEEIQRIQEGKREYRKVI